MPKKIKFKVLRVSGEDERYKAAELDNHGPSVRGWLSSKNCSFPQEIIFELQTSTILHQIQILAHHYIIPERIDVWVGSELQNDDDENKEPLLEYIGYITLSNNENTKFKCRELKTIQIPFSTPTKYVKLTLYENHNNNLNVYDQVGLVAIQLLGDDTHRNEQLEKSSSEEPTQSDTTAFDDLAFEMYIDIEIANLMKQLEQKKRRAVEEERYEYARKLKLAMTKLHQAGEKLGKMEIAKKQAIQQEDYSKAKKKKIQMEEFRSELYTKLNIDSLLEQNGPLSMNDEEQLNEVENSLSRLLSKEENGRMSNIEKETSEVDFRSAKPSPVTTSTQQPSNETTTFIQNIDQTPGIYESPMSPLHFVDSVVVSPYNDVPFKPPSLSSKTNSLKRRPISFRTSHDEEVPQIYKPCFQQGETVKDPQSANTLSQIFTQSKLNEREKKQVTLAVHIFGKTLVEKIFSKQYADKEEGLRLLTISLKSYIEKEKEEHRMADKTMYSYNKIGRAATYLFHRCLRDKVFAVYNAAIEVIRFFFCEFVTKRITSAEISRCVEQILPDLLSKSGDSTARVHNLAIHTILSLADAPEVRKLNIIPNHLTRVLTANVHNRLALSKLEMVEQLILSHGIFTDKQSGMTCRILADFGLSGLHHPAEAVRKNAEKILILVYKSNPRLIRKQLPPDDEVTRRNILYRHLMHEFDKIDIERKTSAKRATSTRRDTLRSDLSDTEVEWKYSDYFGKTLHQANSDQKLRRCIFCRLQSDKLTDKELNIHYWKYCPLLMRCVHCNQVTEIAALQEHLTDECDMKSSYRKCQVCSQAVNIEQLNTHHTSVQCTLMSMKKACPLCFMELEDGPDTLRIHLMGNGTSICPKLPRAQYLSATSTE